MLDAAQCDVSKEILAGIIEINKVVLSIVLENEIEIFGEIEVYVGNSVLYIRNNKFTVSPGLLSCKISAVNYNNFECEYTLLEDICDNLYITAL